MLGGQIAWHSAFKGKTVVVHDISSDGLDKCRAAHEQYAAVYPKDVGATDSDIEATRARLTEFLAIPDLKSVPEIVARAKLS